MNITKRFRNIAIVIVGLLVLPIGVALLIYPPVYVCRATVWTILSPCTFPISRNGMRVSKKFASAIYC